MFAKIMEISTLAGTPMTYVLIHIWASEASHTKDPEKPTGDNQFIMDLVLTDTRPVLDGQGRHKTLDGRFIHPDRADGSEDWEVETFKVEVAAEIRAHIEEYLGKRKSLSKTKNPYPDFHARPALVRDNQDPRGILALSDVQGMIGRVATVK